MLCEFIIKIYLHLIFEVSKIIDHLILKVLPPYYYYPNSHLNQIHYYIILRGSKMICHKYVDILWKNH